VQEETMRKYTRALTFEKSWSLLNGGHMESARARASERARERESEREREWPGHGLRKTHPKSKTPYFED
jgi:hypothetical protein